MAANNQHCGAAPGELSTYAQTGAAAGSGCGDDRRHERDPMAKSQTIADAVNMFYPEMHAAAMADPSFAMISDDFKRPRKAVSKKSLHSRNAYELPIPGRKDYVVKVYPDDENKVAIVPPSDSWPHFFDAVNFWLTGGGACNYFYAKKILENTIRQSVSNRSVGYGCEAPSATPSHG